MINTMNRTLIELMASDDIVIPTLLGKKFCFRNDERVFQVVGTRWRSQQIIAQELATGKTLILAGEEFFKEATVIDE